MRSVTIFVAAPRYPRNESSVYVSHELKRAIHTTDDFGLSGPAGPGLLNIPVLSVWRTFAKENNGREYEEEPDLYHDGSPYQSAKRLGEVKHEDVGANTQFHQSHTIKIEQLTQPEVPQKPLHIARMRQNWIPDMSPQSNLRAFIAEHCTRDCHHLSFVSRKSWWEIDVRLHDRSREDDPTAERNSASRC